MSYKNKTAIDPTTQIMSQHIIIECENSLRKAICLLRANLNPAYFLNVSERV